MTRRQRRLHRYRQGRPAAAVAMPRLADGVNPEARGGRVTFRLERRAFSAEVSMPARPAGWVILAGAGNEELEVGEFAALRLERATPAAILAAAAELRTLPEARALPLAIAAGEDAGEIALRAASALGRELGALVLAAPADGPVVLTPTLYATEHGDRLEAALAAALGVAPHPRLAHAQRRRLALALARAMRREAPRRGALNGASRAGFALLASALAFTLSASLNPERAAASWTTIEYDSGTGQLRFFADAGADQLTLDCTAGDLEYDTGTGPQNINNPFPPFLNLPCTSALTLTVSGGNGVDTLDLSGVDGTDYTQLQDGEVTVAAGGGGGLIDGPDNIGENSLAGGSGLDTIQGGNDTDLISGAIQDDSMLGGGGSDTLDYSAATNGISGGIANGDTLTGQGDDTVTGIENVFGSPQADSLSGGSGAVNSLVGADGGDTLTAAGASDTIDAGLAADSLLGGSGATTLLAGDGNDTVTGSSAVDSISGLAGADSLNGGGGADVVSGGTENDTLIASTASESLNGDAGEDAADYSGVGGPVTINLSTDSATGAGTDTLTLIEHATGTGSADSISGDTAANTLAGLAGSDTFSGLAGNDTILAGNDADSVDAGGSVDSISGGTGDDTLLPSTGVPGSMETISGGDQNDSISSSSGTEASITGDGGTDTIFGSNSADSIDAGAGTDTVDANAGDDTILGGTENDTLLGDGDDDTVDGGGGSDTLDGRFGLDSLDGGLGNADTVRGAADSDSVLGGAGSGDLVTQANGVSPVVLTDTSLTGEGTDTLGGGFEAASLDSGSANGLIDASAFSGGPVSLASGSSGGTTLIGSPAADSLTAFSNLDVIRQTTDAATQSLSGDGSSATLTGLGPDTIAGALRYELTGGASANALDASGHTGTVTLDGQGANDTLSPAPGGGFADSLIGAGGTDRVSAQRDVDQTLTNTSLDASGAIDTLSSIEQASLRGGAAGNRIDASAFTAGSVTLDGDAANDTLVPSGGADSLSGGVGTGDRVEQSSDAAAQTLSATQLTGSGTDTLATIETASLSGGASANQISAAAFPTTVTLAGGGADDTLEGGGATDQLSGDGGNDRVVQTADSNQVLSDTSLTGIAGGDFLSSIERASLSGGASSNTINASAFSNPVSLAGLGGSDTLTGTTGADSLDAGTGSDTLERNADENMTLSAALFSSAGTGSDSIGGYDAASLTGGSGANLLDASGFAGPVTLSGATGDDTMLGGDGSDLLQGSFDTDRVLQTAAAQTLNDTLLSGDGNDTLSLVERASLTGSGGGEAIDASAFTAGPVSLDGAGGSDTLTGGAAADSLSGGDAADRLLGGPAADTASGGNADDTLVAAAGNDSLSGDAGTLDRLENASPGNQTLGAALLTDGGDSVTHASIERASLSGDAGVNSLDASGFGGAVTLSGGGAADTLTGSTGSDSLDGGTSTDRLVRTAAANQTLADGQLSVAGLDTDSLASIEEASLSGGNGGQRLDASAFTSTVTLAGFDGDDTLIGSTGTGSLDGGTGAADRVEQTTAAVQTLSDAQLTGAGTDAITAIETASLSGDGSANSIDASAFTVGSTTLAGLGGSDTLDGGSAGDSLSGGSEGDDADGNGGPDTVDGGAGDDVLDGGAGTDGVGAMRDADLTLTDTLLAGGGESDTLVAGSFEAPSLTGGAAANALDASGWNGGGVQLDGQGGADSLLGSAGPDTLLGAGENDLLRGSAGGDSLDGGAGTNTGDFSDSAGPIAANLATGSASGAGADSLASLQALVGSAAGDSLTGGGGAETLSGLAGADLLSGGGGQDLLQGLAGNDTLSSQDGGIVDTADCGADTDLANADVGDSLIACETINNPPPGQPGGPPANPPPPDTQAPALTVAGDGKQKSKKTLVFEVSCDESCDVDVSGTIKVPIMKANGKVKKKKTYDLEDASTDLDANSTETMNLTYSGKVTKKLKKALKAKKKSTAKIEATATDAAGNVSPTGKLKVKIKK